MEKNSENAAKKQVTIINQDSGYLMVDIANAYVAKGYAVSLVTGRLVLRNHTLDAGVKVHKITGYDRSSTLKRLGTWGLGFLQILFLVVFKHRKSHLLLVSNPPFATLIPLFVTNSFSLLIYDIYPDALVEYKILKENSFFIQWWKNRNKKIFARAAQIFTLSEGMKTCLAQYITPPKIKVVDIWTDNSFLKPMEKTENPFLKEHHLQDKFLVLYSGNLGKTHRMEKLLEVAQLMPEDPYYFLIIGGGDKFELLQNELKKRNLSNLSLMPWQPAEKLPFTLAAADIGIVSLGHEASNLSIPSKTFNLMSVGVPILSIANKASALASLVRENEIGENFEPEEVLGMVDFIRELAQNKTKRTTLSKNALQLSKNYSPKNAYKFVI